jgi:hypothetical protein
VALLESQVCSLASLTSPRLLHWAAALRPAWDPSGSGVPYIAHRQLWEWAFVAEALHERGLLGSGTRGVGFGVGREPLPSLFASLGSRIVATDQAPEAARDWADVDQYAGDLDALNAYGICDPDAFRANVSYRTVDMRAIPTDLAGFDFAWSSCAFEHLGSIGAGVQFVLDQMRCLRPGGVAVHTTEYNVSSNHHTVLTGNTVLFRRRDLEALATTLRRQGHTVSLDFTLGDSEADQHVDRQPWSGAHLRLEIAGFVASSFALIVRKSTAGPLVAGSRRAVAAGMARASSTVRALSRRTT